MNDASPGPGNFSDIYWDVDKARTLFSGWQQVVLASSGPVPSSVRNAMAQNSDFSLIYDSKGDPTLNHYDEADSQPADLSHLEGSMTVMDHHLPMSAPMFIYLSGHGGRGVTHLVGSQFLNEAYLTQILKQMNPSRPKIMIFDTCEGASMFPAILRRKNACGFSAARANEVSYSGQMIMDSAMKSKSTFSSFAEVLRQLRFEDQRGSLSMATSDAFLENYYDHHNFKTLKNWTALRPVREGYDLWSQQVIRVRQEAQRALLDSTVVAYGINHGISPNDFLRTLTDWQKVLSGLGERLDRLSERINAALTEDVKTESNWIFYSRTPEILAELRTRQRRETSPEARQDIQAAADRLQERYEQFQQEISAFKADVLYGQDRSPEKIDFYKFADPQEDEVCPDEILEGHGPRGLLACLNAGSSQRIQLQKQLVPFERMILLLKEANALESMSQTNDRAAIESYLSLIACEQTRYQ